MAQNGRFDLGLRVLAVLAAEPETRQTSAAIAEKLGESAVMVRRAFLQLHGAGLIVQRKGPNGGARLKRPAKEVGMGDLFVATLGAFAAVSDKSLEPLLKRVQGDAVKAMNETTLSQVVKRLKKS
jgi:DNA-binding IscR family transcriptional regulator